MTAPFVRHPYNYDTRAASDETATTCPEPSLTVQDQAEDADINVIMRRFGMGQPMPDNPRVPTYGDFTEVTDYRSAVHAVMAADEAFAELPPHVRAAFANDPQNLLLATTTPGNEAALQAIGLLPTKEPPKEPAAIDQAIDALRRAFSEPKESTQG